jgi:hypothetical protein
MMLRYEAWRQRRHYPNVAADNSFSVEMRTSRADTLTPREKRVDSFCRRA